jgi:leader peptidase (prepilin peptidase)/N-methyltransferase
VTPVWVVVAGAVGMLLGPLLRGRIFHHSVVPDAPWRRDCPHCGHPLVPPGWRGLAGALPSSGRCPSCDTRIGPPPFTVEALTAVVFVLLALRVDRPLPLAAYCWLAAIGVALAFIDVAVHRLPDQLTAAAVVGVLGLLGAAALVDGEPARLGWAVLNGLGMAAAYLVLALIYPAGMGQGDVKLAVSLGTALGWTGWVVTVLGTSAGFLSAGLFSLGLLVVGRANRKTEIPHGPFMLLGTLATVLLLGSV